MTADIPSSELTEQILEAEAIADLTQKLTLAGHLVNPNKSGGFTVSKWNQSRHCLDLVSLIQFCQQLGIH
jgi:hypothetical protein